MRMQKRQFRIGDLAKQLEVEKFVIRFWEKEFKMSSTRSIGGQRFYSEDDLAKFQQIKSLLYKEGFTIAGAKKQLSIGAPAATTNVVGSRKTTMDEQQLPPALVEHLALVKKQLEKLYDLL